MYCAHCGRELAVSTGFCPGCGKQQAASIPGIQVPGATANRPIPNLPNSTNFNQAIPGAQPNQGSSRSGTSRNKAIAWLCLVVGILGGYVTYNSYQAQNFLTQHNFSVAAFEQNPIFTMAYGGQYFGFSTPMFARWNETLTGKTYNLMTMSDLQTVSAVALVATVTCAIYFFISLKKK